MKKYLIMSIYMLSGLLALSQIPADSSDSIGLKIISDFIEKEVQGETFVGAEILITKNNVPLLHRAYGWNDMENSLPLAKNTIYNIRSMTKTYIAAGIHILIEQNRLRYDTRVSELLPGFNNDRSKEITIRHLLSHTSGLPVSFAYGNSLTDYRSLTELANAIGKNGPSVRPGDKFQYSDAGAEVLAAVIELVSKTSLSEFLRKNIFLPLNMTDTYPISESTDFRNDRVASLYGGSPGKWNKFWDYRDNPMYPFPLGSQSFYSSPTDYSKFMSMILNNGLFNEIKILSPESVGNILTPENIFKMPGADMEFMSGFPDCAVYHGLMSLLYCSNEKNGKLNVEVFGYGGSDGTFSWVLPVKGFVISVFTQSRNFSSSFPFYKFEKLVYQNLINPKWGDSLQKVSPFLQPYLGKYIASNQGNENTIFEVVEKMNGLAIIIPGQPQFELYPPDEDENWYFKASDMLSVSFTSDDSGFAKGLTFCQKTNFIKKIDPNSIGSPEMEGEYTQPYMNLTIRIKKIEEYLDFQIGEEDIIRLIRDEISGIWTFPGVDNKCLEFIYDENGDIVSLNILDLLNMQKVS